MKINFVDRKYLGAVLLLISLAESVMAQSGDSTSGTSPHGYIDVNGYFDSRNSSDFTADLLSRINNRTSYFTFTNFFSGTPTLEQNRYYSEHHFYRSMTESSPFDWSAQWMTISGNSNDAFRLGMRWRLANTNGLAEFCKQHNLIYTIAFHLFQADANKSRTPFLNQVEHFYRIGWLNNRLYLSGFADMDMYYKSGVQFSVVTEHQLGIKMFSGLYAVIEYRYNDYAVSKNGVGMGLQYIISY